MGTKRAKKYSHFAFFSFLFLLLHFSKMNQLTAETRMIHQYNLQAAEALQALRQRSILLMALRTQEEQMLHEVSIKWMECWICPRFIDGVCPYAESQCDRIHFCASLPALKQELKICQDSKSFLANRTFAMLMMSAEQGNYRCLHLLKALEAFTGKYLWPQEWNAEQTFRKTQWDKQHLTF
jgi:hypothetical protein